MRETGERNQLDSKVADHSDSATKSNLAVLDLLKEYKLDTSSNHSPAQHGKYLDMGSAHDLYGSKGGDDLYGSMSAHDSVKGAHSSVHRMSDQQPDLGKAIQDWAGSIIDAGKHALEGLGKEAPKPTVPEESEPEEVIVPFNPKIHGTGPTWTISQFEKWLAENENNDEIPKYPLHDKPFPDCDPGFRLPMDRPGAPEIDRGFTIPSDRTTRKVIKNDDLNSAHAGSTRDEDIAAVLAGLH